jgi:FkbM family methyltransferase
MSIATKFYDHAKIYIDMEEIDVVYDIGAGDCQESIELQQLFKQSSIFSFEANPACIYDCEKKIKNIPGITFFPICINNYTGITTFHPIDQEKTITTWKDGNPKASSLFLANGTYKNETYFQDSIQIPCMRIDDIQSMFKIPLPDIVWMDLQGAELAALQSMGNNLSHAKIIHTEVWGQAIYEGQSLFNDLESYMTAHGFISRHEPFLENWVWSDVDFIREDILYKGMTSNNPKGGNNG